MAYLGYAILGALWGALLYWFTTGSKSNDLKKAAIRSLSLFIISAIPGPIVSSIGCELLLYRYPWLKQIVSLPQFIAFVSGWVGYKALILFGEKGIDFTEAFSKGFWSSFIAKGAAKPQGKSDDE